MTSMHEDCGKIVTFYSFKGGVGRTMAVANLAFLAALNGSRVLVMDWDLEAPGLGYYFRGLMEASTLRKLRESPGVLDLLWDWSVTTREAKHADEYDRYVKQIKSGQLFERYVSPVPLESDFAFFPHQIGGLDFIGAGGLEVATPDRIPYADALAQFSWSSFIGDEGGGLLLSALRDWSREKYDYVFIDSRTGMADVAGVCTMQLPDAVAMCFILNRQNIDGVSRVAQAIQQRRGDAIELFPVPMRVASKDTAEENDARAYAIRSLSQSMRVASESIREQFRQLEVASYDSVPFYESLAPFVASDASLDPLTLSYVRLANQVLGQTYGAPSLDLAWLDVVTRRLRPRNATIDYIKKLGQSDPLRQYEELQALLDGIQESIVDGAEPSAEYVFALSDAAAQFGEYDALGIEPGDLHLQVIDVLRLQLDRAPGNVDYRLRLIRAIERYIDECAIGVLDEQDVALYEELDSLLADIPTVDARLTRIRRRLDVASRAVTDEDWTAVTTVVGEIRTLTGTVRKDRSATPLQRATALSFEAESFAISGEARATQGQVDRAMEDYRNGLSFSRESRELASTPEQNRVEFRLYRRLAIAPGISPNEAAAFAIRAYELRSDTFVIPIAALYELAPAVLESTIKESDVRRFCTLAFAADEPQFRSQFHFYFGRTSALAVRFCSLVRDFVNRLIRVEDSVDNSAVISLMYERVEQVLRTVLRRRHTMNDRMFGELAAVVEELLTLAQTRKVDTTALCAIMQESFGGPRSPERAPNRPLKPER